MKLFFLVAVSIIIIQITPAFSQAPAKHVKSREQLWFGVLNQTRLSKHWGFWLEGHYRMTDDFVDRPATLLLRPGLAFYLKDNLRLHAGYAFVQHYPAAGLRTTRTEHRPWQQIFWTQKYPGLSTIQWLRSEQRFNERIVNDVKEDGYNYNFRVRYNFAFFVPLVGKELAAGIPFAVLINEIFLNLGDNVVYNTFDQNRLFVGLGYNITSHLNAQLGYLNVYQQEASGNAYVKSHTIRLMFFHNLNLRRDD